MAPKQQLEAKLKEILGSDAVYFQPPEDFQLSYPCIIYKRSNIRSSHADNQPYKLENQYSITVIDPDSGSTIPDKVAQLPRCVFERNFGSDYLYHNIFNIMF
jgi:hypothetical protein